MRAIAVVLVSIVIVSFEPSRHNGFISFDDPIYLTENPHVQRGLTSEGLAWAFNAGYASNWHPLTWLSHMLDVSLWGLDPGAHHLTSLAIHAANAVLLFLVLRKATGAEIQSAIVAAIFAVHPLRVESVAWASERKDVLSTFFAFLCLWSWVGWTRRGGGARYFAALAAFAASLAAKPMMVTLPFLLLLLDLWPLRRAFGSRPAEAPARESRTPLALVREKLPFFALAAASSVITFVAQNRDQAVVALGQLPISLRLENATWSYLVYFGKALWPADLAIFYPFPVEGLATAKVLLAGAFLLVGTALGVQQLRSRPWLLVGWLWWVGTLVPVIGIVQVGEQALADRYSYLPMIGLSIAFVFGLSELFGTSRAARSAGVVLATVAICAFVGVTRAQTAVWRDDYTLFSHAAEVTERNPLAHTRLGIALLDRRRPEEAVRHFELALQFAPHMRGAHNNLGVGLLHCKRYAEAVEAFTRAVRADPAKGQTHLNLGGALIGAGRTSEAILALRAALQRQPDLAEARRLLERLQGPDRSR